MGHQTLQLKPGVNTTETPTLNEAGVQTCQLIRYVFDKDYGAMIQKLGGWLRFYPSPIAATIRSVWAWEDINSEQHLAYGTQNLNTGSAQLAVITSGVLEDITPQSTTENITPNVSTTMGSAVVNITDTTIGTITQYDSVYITTQIAVGGLILFGMYACDPDGFGSATAYDIFSRDVLGNLLPATSTVANGGVVPEFSTTAGAIATTVTLPNHGLSVGSTFPVLIPTTVGGVTFAGNFTVQVITDANNFVILAPSPAASTATGFMNGGNAQFIYSFGQGAVPGGTGYGIGGYGSGGYGVGTSTPPATGTNIPANDWVLGNWGSFLLACPSWVPPFGTVQFNPLYVWDPQSGVAVAEAIPTAPPVNGGFFVAMPQRQIIAWGSTFTGVQDPLLVRWCDVNNFNVWIGTITNQAGSYRLTTGSAIVGAIQGPQQGLLWTDIGVWAMQYIGPPLIYGFNEIGKGCGLIAQKAAAAYNGIIYWMGPSQFFTLSGNGVEPLPCSVWDVAYQQIDRTRLNLVRVAVNSLFGEITWYFPTVGSADASTYVKYNAILQVWDYGTLTRTAWVDQSVLGSPIGAGPDTNTGATYLYQHDGTSPTTGLPATDNDVYPMVSSFQSGYAAIAEADYKTFVDQLWPDMKWNYYGNTASSASVQVTFYFTDYPNQPPQSVGPYNLNSSIQYISPRLRGRLVSVSVGSSDAGSFWRVGKMRYRAAPDGKF